MRLLTLNTHSLLEENYGQKLKEFITAVARELPDVIALQEVNQRQDATAVSRNRLEGYVSCEPSATVREGNHALAVAEGLRASEIMYHWTWLPVKRGYGKYDEGLSFLCRSPISEVRTAVISRTDDYENWRRRMALMIRPEGEKAWFCNLHTSWWGDTDEPFAEQWARLLPHVRRRTPVFLMGDFNNPAELRGEGYDLVASCGFWDTYALADVRWGSATAEGGIDGWHGRLAPDEGVRIDQIWCNRPISVAESRTVFDGERYERVSDHFGVLVTVKKGEKL